MIPYGQPADDDSHASDLRPGDEGTVKVARIEWFPSRWSWRRRLRYRTRRAIARWSEGVTRWLTE